MLCHTYCLSCDTVRRVLCNQRCMCCRTWQCAPITSTSTHAITNSTPRTGSVVSSAAPTGAPKDCTRQPQAEYTEQAQVNVMRGLYTMFCVWESCTAGGAAQEHAASGSALFLKLDTCAHRKDEQRGRQPPVASAGCFCEPVQQGRHMSAAGCATVELVQTMAEHRHAGG